MFITVETPLEDPTKPYKTNRYFLTEDFYDEHSKAHYKKGQEVELIGGDTTKCVVDAIVDYARLYDMPFYVPSKLVIRREYEVRMVSETKLG